MEADDSRCYDRFNAEIDEREDDGGAVSFWEETCVESSKKSTNGDDTEVPPGLERVLIIVANGPELLHLLVNVLLDADHDEYVESSDSDKSSNVVDRTSGKFDQLALAKEHDNGENKE